MTYLSRAGGFANYDAATAAPTDFAMPQQDRDWLDAHSVAHCNPADHDVAGDEMPTTGAKSGLKLADMMGKSYDDPDWDKLLDQLTVDEMAQLVQVGGMDNMTRTFLIADIALAAVLAAAEAIVLIRCRKKNKQA